MQPIFRYHLTNKNYSAISACHELLTVQNHSKFIVCERMLKDLLLFCYIFEVSCEILNASGLRREFDKYPNLSSACDIILKHGIERKTPVVNVITDGFADSHRINDFRSDLLVKFSENFESVLRLEASTKISVLANRKRRCNFIIIDDYKNFLDIFPTISSENFKPNGIFFIIILSGKIPEIAKMFQLMWKRQFFNVFVAYMSSDDSVSLESFDPFVPGSCNSSVPILINTFVNGMFTNRLEFFGRNMRNLNRCPLRVAFINTYEPYTLVRENPKSIADFSGEAIQILRRLSASLNFSIEIAFLGPFGNIFPNGSSDCALGALINKNADFSISNWWLIAHRLEFLDGTYPYTCEQIVFTLPAGRELTSLERLVYPFGFQLWILIFFVPPDGIHSHIFHQPAVNESSAICLWRQSKTSLLEHVHNFRRWLAAPAAEAKLFEVSAHEVPSVFTDFARRLPSIEFPVSPVERAS